MLAGASGVAVPTVTLCAMAGAVGAGGRAVGGQGTGAGGALWMTVGEKGGVGGAGAGRVGVASPCCRS